MQRRFLPAFARSGLALMACAAAAGLLASCASTSTAMRGALAWSQRLPDLQQEGDWDMQGRAAVAIGTRGWQASVDWRQKGGDTTLRLAGPLGVGASLLRLSQAGLSINDAPPRADVVAQLQQRLGFALPLANLRYLASGRAGSVLAVRRHAQPARPCAAIDAGGLDDRFRALHARARRLAAGGARAHA